VDIRSREDTPLECSSGGIDRPSEEGWDLRLNPTAHSQTPETQLNYFPHAASYVYSQSPNYLTLSMALFSPYVCEPMWREIKRMVKLNLEVRACILEESPDIVISWPDTCA